MTNTGTPSAAGDHRRQIEESEGLDGSASPGVTAGAPTPMTDDDRAAATADLCFGHLSHIEMASKVRMLMRGDIEHEPICVGARDRIVWLAQREHDLLAEVRRLRAERDAAPPPGGQTVEQAIEAFGYASFSYALTGQVGRPPSIGPASEKMVAARTALLHAIAAREAEVARAAITSLREPNDTAIDAGAEFLARTVNDWKRDPFNLGESGPVNDAAMATYLWQHMIDAALARSLAPAPAGED